MTYTIDEARERYDAAITNIPRDIRPVLHSLDHNTRSVEWSVAMSWLNHSDSGRELLASWRAWQRLLN